MPLLYSSPSYHQISPLSHSSSTAIRRSASYASPSKLSSSGFTIPSAGYGSGFMGRSIARSGSSIFGRSLTSNALSRIPPMHSVGVQTSTPHYSDKYPYVRYSYGNNNSTYTLSSTTDFSLPSHRSSIQNFGSKRYAEGRVSSYNPGLYSTRSKSTSYLERGVTPQRPYVRYMPMEDAMSMYKKGCMTVGTLSKYWLSPSAWQSRREKELNLSSSLSHGNYSYSSRYSGPSYSRFAQRLRG
uniref:Plakophilin-4 n=1 Tax=Strongyloides stercoralis TaxID=6248 RepID=A0A0K0EIJ8_STRER